MDDRKTTLYLAVLCIILMIWGSVLDGKRLHIKEVLEAENAELASLVDETRASYAKAASSQLELQRKLAKLQEQIAELKAKNQELQKLNKELKAELEKEKKLREQAETRADAAKTAPSGSTVAAATAASASGSQFRLQELEARVTQLIRQREELQTQLRSEQQNSFSASLKLTELESQLRYCRERMSRLEEEKRDADRLRSRIRELESQLADRTQELWNTRLSLSADLDACTRQLMNAASPGAGSAATPGQGKGNFKCMGKCKKAAAMQEEAAGKPGCKCKNMQNCMELKKLKMQLDACSTRLDSLQKQFKESGARYLEEIAQLKKAIASKNGVSLAPKPPCAAEKPLPPPADLKLTTANDDIAKLKAEIAAKEKELQEYKKNTEALLEQIRQQRAEIKRLKAAK